MSLEISFSCVSLSLGFSNFWPTVLIKTMIKLFTCLKTYDSSLSNM